MRRFCWLARCQARPVAIEVVPTPPRAPTQAMSLPTFWLSDVAAFGLVCNGLREQLRRHRLEEVFGDAGLDQVAIERDIVAVADRDDRDRRLADIGKIVHPRDREIFAADIDDQNARRALAREVLDRLADVAAQDAQRRYSGRCGAVDDRALGRRVGDKGQQRQAPGRRFRGGVERRGALGLVQRDRDGGGGGSHSRYFRFSAGSGPGRSDRAQRSLTWTDLSPRITWMPGSATTFCGGLTSPRAGETSPAQTAACGLGLLRPRRRGPCRSGAGSATICRVRSRH